MLLNKPEAIITTHPVCVCMLGLIPDTHTNPKPKADGSVRETFNRPFDRVSNKLEDPTQEDGRITCSLSDVQRNLAG